MQNSKKNSTIFSVREIAYLGLMAAAATVGRILLQVIPNVQPMTAIFLILTLQLGASRGVVVCLLSVLVTNLYMGMGVWTIAQLASYVCIICLVGILRQFHWYRQHLIIQIVVSVLAGFIYGFIISVISVQIYGVTSFWVYYLQGLTFDMLHAAGNGGFYWILAPLFGKLFKKLENNEDREN
ncbi:ECF transporter S component [Enterococcus sp. BWB1-3]|uniref:ECF transporter S component n=1 Tax=Enterococcus sp. BWB1-3 TaxID=2787713 RepID=UPI001921DEA1|nr:ECF transporter S component [Enterococcus sp. BWB1-3]MBL1228512.1 ECF transporter S component [Enterococcus sp. BWB1-3]